MRHLLQLIIVSLLITSPSFIGAMELIDQVGNTVTIPEKPKRVVCLSPSLTEIVYALGREDILVGATRFSDYPEAAKKLPRVGTYVRPDLEKIVALAPDLCLATRDGNPLVAVQKIQALGIPVFALDPRNLEQVMESVSLIGNALNAQKKAEILVKDMQRRKKQITNRIKTTTTNPTVFFQIDASPMVSAGSNTFIDELIHLAGGINLTAGPRQYPRFSWEEILHLKPEIVAITSMAGGQSPEELKNDWQRWPTIPAVKNNRVAVVEASLFDRPTPRLIEGLEKLATIIHPELFSHD